MNVQVTNEIRELTAEELEAAVGGADGAWGAARMIGRMLWDTGQAVLGMIGSLIVDARHVAAFLTALDWQPSWIVP